MNKKIVAGFLCVASVIAACSSAVDTAGTDPPGVDAGTPTADASPSAVCTATTCNGHGTCSTTSGKPTCTCDTGYGGATCTECAAGQQDKDGNKTCAPACAANTCSGHGTCNDSTGTAACTCETGYAGANCATCATGYQDKDNDKTCKAACGAATCNSHGTCADTTGTAICTCAAEYTGPACASCATNFQDKDNDKTCKAACGAATCNSHGTCVDTTGTAVCTCTGNFTGAACATCTTGFMGANCDTCVAGKYGPKCDYNIVYGLNIPVAADYNVPADVPYDIDNSAGAGAFTRVAYRLVLDAEEVWVEMDAFTANKNQLGLPVDWIFDQAVTNVTVVSKAGNTPSIAAPTNGTIEFWSNCYAPNGGNNGLYDYDDDYTGQGTDCYGSLQVHVGTNTVFSYSRWSGGGASDIGFGNQAVNHPDWTFAGNAGGFATRRLEVFVK